MFPRVVLTHLKAGIRAARRPDRVMGHYSGSLMLSAVASGKQGPRNHRAGNLDFRLPPADFRHQPGGCLAYTAATLFFLPILLKPGSWADIKSMIPKGQFRRLDAQAAAQSSRQAGCKRSRSSRARHKVQA